MAVKPPFFAPLLSRVDKIVDQWWAEPVELHPWTGGSYTDGGGPDPTRAILKTQAVFITPGSALVGESGTARSSGAFDTMQLENETWLSIQEDNLVDPATWRSYDRVYVVWRAAWFTIAYVSPSATRRPHVYLLRMQINDLGIPIVTTAMHARITTVRDKHLHAGPRQP